MRLYLTKYQAMKMYPVVNEVPLNGNIWGRWDVSLRPNCFTPGERVLSTQWLGDLLKIILNKINLIYKKTVL
jgi:hypothetical protein